MARPKFSRPGDLVYVAPSYAEGRPWARWRVGAAAVVIGLHKDEPMTTSRSHYYEVVIDGKEFLIDVCDVQLEPVHPDWMKDKIE